MPTHTIQRVAILGAGLMGHGIAQEFAVAGYAVTLLDRTLDLADQAKRRISGNLERLAASGQGEVASIGPTLDRIHTVPSLAKAVQDADLVIEAVFEDLSLKQSLFREMDRFSPATAILASNTSTFMPSLLAQATQRADKVIIMHYFNPPYLLPLVEVVPHPGTSEETRETVLTLLRGLGKSPVLVGKEAPGFIGNRLQIALIREALSIVQEGIATPQEVDTVVRTSFGRRLAAAGPFELCETVGWDFWCTVAEQLLPVISSSQEVSPLALAQVERGELGIKTGKGFYAWSQEEADALRMRVARTLQALNALSDK